MKMSMMLAIVFSAVLEVFAVTPPNAGLLSARDNGRRVLVVNACHANTNALSRFVMATEKFYYAPVTIREDEARQGDIYRIAKSYKAENIPSVIYLYSGESDGPILSLYAEDALAAINIAPLKSSTEAIEQDRLEKELLRALGLALGGYYSSKMPSVLAPVYSVGQIDHIAVKMFSPLHMTGVAYGARALKLPNLRPVPYRVACMEGWAPAPTNDAQRIVWDQVHSMPTNPMKIEFDPKKGR